MDVYHPPQIHYVQLATIPREAQKVDVSAARAVNGGCAENPRDHFTNHAYRV